MPLPKPTPGQSINQFLDSCLANETIQSEYAGRQRVAVCYNIYNRSKAKRVLSKQFKENWRKAYEDRLSKSEKTQIRIFRKYYTDNYNTAIEKFQLGQINPELIMNVNEMTELYKQMYLDIGIKQGKWYATNFDKYLKKGVDFRQFLDYWNQAFAEKGEEMAGVRVVSVIATARKVFQQTIQKLMTDESFMAEGADAQARILRRKFKEVSQYQALRIVRTESALAANFATQETARQIFPGSQMSKEWIAGSDARVRPAHREADGQIVKFDEDFLVGGESLAYPGDPRGSAGNVINCRCSTAPIPDEDAISNVELEEIGFGLSGQRT